MRLSTQIHRSLFAMPLLALALAAATVKPGQDVPMPTPAFGMATTLVHDQDCADSQRPAGSRGLARMPGDIGALGRRLRCAT